MTDEADAETEEDPGDVDARPGWWKWALAVVIVVALAAVAAFVVWGGDDEDTTTTGASTTTESSTTTTAASSTTTTTTPDTTTTTATTPSGPVPGVVAVITAGPGGGSGEVELAWDAVADATGYRVVRAPAVDGPFQIVADLDVTTGSTTAAPDVVNIVSAQHSYLPSDGPLAAPDPSPRFQYVDVTSGERCYRVIAYNAAGDGPASSVACGSPP